MNKLLPISPWKPYNSHETINIEILKVSLPLGQFHITEAPNNPWIMQKDERYLWIWFNLLEILIVSMQTYLLLGF